MSKQGISEWLRNNSNQVPVEIISMDGQKLKGSLLVPKDRGLREVLNGAEPFIEFECLESGSTVVSKQSIRSIRQFTLPAGNQLAQRLEYLKTIGAWRTLGLAEGASGDQVLAAFKRLTDLYHPERFPRDRFPDEITDYANSVTRRLYLAYTEISKVLAQAADATDGQAA